jgi:TPR repeat protein
MYASSSQVLNQGVMQDYVEAVKWFRKAADQGNADAQAALGGIYGAGQGARQDYAEAVKWLRKAAEQGNVDAQKNLGVAYALGKGVRRGLRRGREVESQGSRPRRRGGKSSPRRSLCQFSRLASPRAEADRS